MRKATAEKISKLRKSLDELVLEINAEQSVISKKNSNLLKLKAKHDGVRKQLSKLESNNNNKALTISDHAILRTIERVYDIDVEPIREQLINKLTPMYETLGDGTYNIKFALDSDTMIVAVIIRNGNAVTVIDK